MRTLVWFHGNDLRLRDHAPLRDALRQGETVLVYILDPKQCSGPKKAAGHRLHYLEQILTALDRDVEQLGSKLLLARGEPLLVLPWIAEGCRVQQVYTQRHSDPDARNLLDKLANKLPMPLQLFDGHTLGPPGTLRTTAGEPYSVFTAFSKAFAKQMDVKHPWSRPARLPALPKDVAAWHRATLQRPEVNMGLLERVPSLAAFECGTTALAARREVLAGNGERRDYSAVSSLREATLASRAPLPQGGEREALKRLKRFIATAADQYHDARDRIDLAATSRLSADLAFGSVSPRQVWTEVVRAVPDGDGKRRFLTQLLWREFAHSTLWDRPELLNEPFQKRFLGFPWRRDARALSAWVTGRTGYPIVDAAARQLVEEGFVHNRARMIAASFLSKDLLVDFRLGEQHYLENLIDADRAQNDLGWQWSSGCGCDAQPYFRMFNPLTQAQKFDPEGQYVRTYVPELAGLATRHIHAPWKAPGSELASAGIKLGRDYPIPIVDHAMVRNRFLAIASEHFARHPSAPRRRFAQ